MSILEAKRSTCWIFGEFSYFRPLKKKKMKQKSRLKFLAFYSRSRRANKPIIFLGLISLSADDCIITRLSEVNDNQTSLILHLTLKVSDGMYSFLISICCFIIIYLYLHFSFGPSVKHTYGIQSYSTFRCHFLKKANFLCVICVCVSVRHMWFLL